MALRVREVRPTRSSAQAEARPSRWPLVAGVLAAVAALAVLAWLVADPTGGEAQPQEASTRPLPGGLEQGDATASYDLATDEVHGVPRGFPRTTAGAVEASAAGWEFLRFVGGDRPDAMRLDLLNEVFPAAVGTDQSVMRQFDGLATGMRERYGLDESGDPVSGQPGDRFYNHCWPEYGAYRVTTRSPQSGPLSRVGVQIWMPCVEGTGSPSHIDELRIDWRWSGGDMLWSQGDWRFAPEKADDLGASPVPNDKLRPNVGVEERARLLSAGTGAEWSLFEGWSEAWPADLLGEEPK